METFKIDLFKNEHKSDFPHFISLSTEKCLILVDGLLKKYEFANINSLIMLLYSDKKLLLSIDACKEFKLIDTLNLLKVNPQTNVYINWYRFDVIDIFNINDIDKYFFDIWYPSSDDIDIFDESLDWIISIRHDGSVSFLKHV
jgi:hypothetical protein